MLLITQILLTLVFVKMIILNIIIIVSLSDGGEEMHKSFVKYDDTGRYADGIVGYLLATLPNRKLDTLLFLVSIIAVWILL